MPSGYEILCIKKCDRTDPHEPILSLGGRNEDGTAWKLAQQDTIDGIETGKRGYYARRGGGMANVVVAVGRFDHKYIKTEADGEQPDNLLSLPECR